MMFRKVYDWTLSLAAHRHAMRWLAIISFAESSFFPIPPDVVVAPMVLARRDEAYKIAAICTISSVLGGILGYFIGYALLETVGGWLISLYGMSDGLAEYQTWYAEYGAFVILAKGFTPIPFKLVTIASGVAHFSLPMFILMSVITRGARFFLLAWAIKKFGAPIQAEIEKRINLFGTLFLVLLIGGFVAVALI